MVSKDADTIPDAVREAERPNKFLVQYITASDKEVPSWYVLEAGMQRIVYLTFELAQDLD